MSSQQNKNSVSDRVYIAQQVLAAVRKVPNIIIKGGFVRDGGYLPGGGIWATSSSDIDLEIIAPKWEFRKPLNYYEEYFHTRKTFIESVSSDESVTVLSQGQVTENMLQGMYCGGLYRMVLQYQKTQVSIDICFDPAWKLDFDVNALALGSEQNVISKSDDVSLDTTRDNIKKKQFRVMWNPIWKKSRQLEIINRRIEKMEARGWKCLNPAKK